MNCDASKCLKKYNFYSDIYSVVLFKMEVDLVEKFMKKVNEKIDEVIN